MNSVFDTEFIHNTANHSTIRASGRWRQLGLKSRDPHRCGHCSCYSSQRLLLQTAPSDWNWSSSWTIQKAICPTLLNAVTMCRPPRWQTSVVETSPIAGHHIFWMIWAAVSCCCCSDSLGETLLSPPPSANCLTAREPLAAPSPWLNCVINKKKTNIIQPFHH